MNYVPRLSLPPLLDGRGDYFDLKNLSRILAVYINLSQGGEKGGEEFWRTRANCVAEAVVTALNISSKVAPWRDVDELKIESWEAAPGPTRLNAAKIGDSFENVRGNQTSPPPLLSQSTTKINRAKLSLDDSTISPSVAALTRDKPFNSPL